MAQGAFLMLVLNTWKGPLRVDSHLSLRCPCLSVKIRDYFPSRLDRHSPFPFG